MFGKIAALLSLSLLAVATKKKAPRVKSKSKAAPKSTAKKTRAKGGAKRETEAAKTQGTRGEAQPAPVEPELPPPPPPIQAPALFSPAPGATLDTITPSFRWFYVGGTSHYQLVWSMDANFHKMHILLTNQTAATIPPEQALEQNTTYFWRVRGGNESGEGPWSVTRTFRTPES